MIGQKRDKNLNMIAETIDSTKWSAADFTLKYVALAYQLQTILPGYWQLIIMLMDFCLNRYEEIYDSFFIKMYPNYSYFKNMCLKYAKKGIQPVKLDMPSKQLT